MGCAHSQNIFKRINDRNLQLPHNKLFKVINVDDLGKEMSLGKIEITEYELILHQENKNPMKWPLRLLRRYGHDNNLFTFECGRRCATGEGVYAFRCNEAEELFNVVRIATENSANTPESSLIDQINKQIDKNDQSSNCILNTSNSKNSLNKEMNITNQLKQINNNVPPKLPSHFYANDIREYMNLATFDNNYINRDSSPLLKQDFDFSQTNINLNYAKLEDLQLQLKNLNNNSIKNQYPIPNSNDYQNSVQIDQLNNYDQTFINQNNNMNNNEIINSIKLGKKDLKLNDLKLDEFDHQLNYTTIVLDSKNETELKNDFDETCYITTAPATPIYKNTKYNDFKIPNSVPTSPTRQDDCIQQYSTIDFNKTKALTGIINDLNQTDQINKIES